MKIMKEKRSHGNHLFPFAFYNLIAEKDMEACYLHWHEEVEWIYVYIGKISLFIDGKEKIISQGQLAIIEPFLLHYIVAKENCHYFSCVFKKELLKFEIEDVNTYQHIIPYINNELVIKSPITINDDNIEEMFLRIVTIYNHETITHQLEIRIYLLIIFKYFIDHQLLITNDYSKHNLEAIEIVLKYIEEHYDEKITSQMLAKLLNYNHQYFSRFFKDNTGYTPIEYINKYRIDMACEELLDEKKSILDISIACGFDSCSYFIKKFKALKNISPSKYRKLLLANYQKKPSRYDK